MGERIQGEEIRRVRLALKESQTKFGARFGKHRRSVIRWEKSGHYFDSWVGWRARSDPPVKPQFALWQQAVAEIEARKLKPKVVRAVARLVHGVTRRRRSARKRHTPKVTRRSQRHRPRKRRGGRK